MVHTVQARQAILLAIVVILHTILHGEMEKLTLRGGVALIPTKSAIVNWDVT